MYVRSAPSVDSAYPFFRLDRGNLVRVAEETAGWARVAVVGPTFTDAFGFVRDDRRLRVAADGRTAQVVSRADILAPNLSARFSPDSSWATIGRLEPGTTVAISETVRGQRETMHKIGLPASAEGWVNLTFLRRANAEELARLDPGLRDPEPGAAVRPTGDAAPPRGGSDVVRSAEATTMVIVDDADGDLEIDALEETVEVVTEPTRTEQRPVLVPEPPARPAPRAADQIARVTLADLEFAFSQLAKEDPESAEVGPLRQRYLEFAERIAALDSERAFARTRADQLEIKEEIQERLAEVRRLQARQGADLEVIRGRRVAVEARQPYVAVGRLNASTVYDGRRLPLLFRVQDPSGGQTIGYLEPGGGFELTSLLGQLVGIVGTRSYDESLRLNIISPTRIDVLTTAPGSITIRP
ncbi:MAG TPA: hypothetical protein PKC43_10430 [Phycisphaerales bacterium]|nr:hypothetical protein [Phycisphaerales bacterium]HMP37852.1 hypothetical protein [Phycisphaerales bacterium]